MHEKIRVMDLGQVVLDLEEVSRIPMEVHINKTKVPGLIANHTLPICIDGRNIEDVDQFVYFGSVISVDGGTKLNIIRPINSTKSAFVFFP